MESFVCESAMCNDKLCEVSRSQIKGGFINSSDNIFAKDWMWDDKLCEVSRSQIRGEFINSSDIFAKVGMWDEIAGRDCLFS